MSMDAVERALRAHARAAKGSAGLHYRFLSGDERYWPGAASVSMVRALDQAGECQRVAVEASERFKLAIVVGWCFDLNGRPCWHCANLNRSGQLVDAGLDRRRPGFLGKVLSEREAALLARGAREPTASELRERSGALLAALLG